MFFVGTYSSPDLQAYLTPGPRSDSPQVHHVSRNAQHGRERREPAKRVRPPRVLVVQVLNRSPLHEVEDKNALKWTTRKTSPSAGRCTLLKIGLPQTSHSTLTCNVPLVSTGRSRRCISVRNKMKMKSGNKMFIPLASLK